MTDPTKPVVSQAFAPCPTCGQYSHSIGEDAIADAFMHFESMFAHPVRGTPMEYAFDDKTRDAAQVLVAAVRHRAASEAKLAVAVEALRAYVAFAGEAAGTCLGVALSTEHPAPDEALMDLFRKSQDLSKTWRDALATLTGETPK